MIIRICLTALYLLLVYIAAITHMNVILWVCICMLYAIWTKNIFLGKYIRRGDD